MKAFRDAWNNLATRIQGLEAAILGFTQTVNYACIAQTPTPDVQDRLQIAEKVLLPSLKECFQEILLFRDQYRSQLIEAAIKCIDRFESIAKSALGEGATTGRHQIQSIVAFVALRTELNYYCSDREFQMKRLVERAFLHLKRSIIADPIFARNWQDAHGKGETACEGLGAIHLLLHGIWAFKVEATQERTDLVLGTRLADDEAIQSADALILTEWKKADKDSSQIAIEKLIEAAIKQAKIYKGSSLAGYEVHSVKYIPIVSWDRVNVKDQEDGEVLYRVINIPVCPSKPSKAKTA